MLPNVCTCLCACVCVLRFYKLCGPEFISKCITAFFFFCSCDWDFPSILFSEDDVFVIFFAYKKAFNSFGKTQVKQVSL